jgi:hypothetical protein
MTEQTNTEKQKKINNKKIIAVSICIIAIVSISLLYCGLNRMQAQSNIEELNFSDSGSELKNFMHQQNISIVQSEKSLFIPTVEGDYFTEYAKGKLIVNCYRFINSEDYQKEIVKDSIKSILTDELLFRYPQEYEQNTMYIVSNYNLWYYVNDPNIGVIAKVFPAQISAFASYS